MDSAERSFTASREGSVCLRDAIEGRTVFSLSDHLDALAASRDFLRNSWMDKDKEVLNLVSDGGESDSTLC